MRRPKVNHKEIDLEIEIMILDDIYTHLSYYSIDGNPVKETLNSGDLDKRLAEIKKERHNLCIWDNGEKTYPMRKK